MSGAVRWTVSSVCRRDPVPSVSAEKEAWEGGFYWYLTAGLRWSQTPERQLWDGHGGDARDRWERRGEIIVCHWIFSPWEWFWKAFADQTIFNSILLLCNLVFSDRSTVGSLPSQWCTAQWASAGSVVYYCGPPWGRWWTRLTPFLQGIAWSGRDVQRSAAKDAVTRGHAEYWL